MTLTNDQLVEIGRTAPWRMQTLTPFTDEDDRANELPDMAAIWPLDQWPGQFEAWIREVGVPKRLGWAATRAAISDLIAQCRDHPDIERTDDGWVLSVDDPTLRIRMSARLHQDGSPAKPASTRAANAAYDVRRAEQRLTAQAAELAQARGAQDRARDAMADAVKRAAAARVSQYRIRRITGLAKDTVRRWATPE